MVKHEVWEGEFYVDKEGERFYKISYEGSSHILYVPVPLIRLLDEEEWVYDSAGHNRRKDSI